MPKLYQYGLPVLFALLLVAAWSDIAFFGARTQVPGFDNRAKEEPPEFRLDYLDPFPRRAEAWFNDHFPWRGFFQRFNGQVRSVTGARSPLPDKVVFGKDDWLFKGGLQLDIYRGKRRFSPAELTEVVAELKARRDSIEARGGQYYFSIAPLKHHIYPHLLPDHVRPLNREYATRQLYAALVENDVALINLHDDLQAYARAHPPIPLDTANLQTTDLFHRTDHHWTVRAGYLATETLLRRFRADGFPVELPDASDFTYIARPQQGLTLAQIVGVDAPGQDVAYYLKHDYPIERVDRPDVTIPWQFPYREHYVMHYRHKRAAVRAERPTLFVTRESFGENISQILSSQFGEAYWLFDEWEHKLNLDHYEREGGDVYLQFVWEGFIFNLLDLPVEDGKW